MMIGLSIILLLGINALASAPISLGHVNDERRFKIQEPMINNSANKHTFNGVCNLGGHPHQSGDYNHIVPVQLQRASVPSPSLEIKPLRVSGPSENRVDLVFFSDGYTAEESDKFFADAKRLADDVSQNQTFFTVQPLLNFWGAYTPSVESGVGVGGKPKNTVYGLYRDGLELRGVNYDKPEVAHAACDSMGDQCDYPILLGNDPLYGGLGGEFTVVTASILNGPLVLRHELGHSIIDVGEEYDGGFAYFGVNAAHNLSEPVPWAHWLSNPPSDFHSHSHSRSFEIDLRNGDLQSEGMNEDEDLRKVENLGSNLEILARTQARTQRVHVQDNVNANGDTGLLTPLGINSVIRKPNIGGPRVERSVMPIQIYPWVLLNTSLPFTIQFISSGAFSRHLIKFSISGIPESSDLRVELDDEDLGWIVREDVGLDRWHYDILRDVGLKGGLHELRFVLINKEREGVGMLGSAEVLEFGDEDEFIMERGFYGLFPTYSDENQTSYRPTNQDCLMRDVTTPGFCKVCIEGLWISLLKRVDLIDDLVESCTRVINAEDDNGSVGGNNEDEDPIVGGGGKGKWMKSFQLHLLPLAQFREPTVQGRTNTNTNADADTNPNNEAYTITWEKDGRILHKFTNMTKLDVVENGNGKDVIGRYTVRVEFSTDEVRVDKDGLLKEVLVRDVDKMCSDMV